MSLFRRRYRVTVDTHPLAIVRNEDGSKYLIVVANIRAIQLRKPYGEVYCAIGAIAEDDVFDTTNQIWVNFFRQMEERNMVASKNYPTMYNLAKLSDMEQV